jgi:hypothetical protein
MRICLVTPAPSGSRKGNRVTAERWAHVLRELGHRVTVTVEYRGQRCDLLIALHAFKSYPAICRFRDERPNDPLVLCLTGTDLYGDIHTQPEARESLELATRLVVLQPLGLDELPQALRDKGRVIYQSVSVLSGGRKPPERISGGLRPPLRGLTPPAQGAYALRSGGLRPPLRGLTPPR